MSSSPKEKNGQVFIGHLSWKVKEEDLDKKFKSFGSIKEISIKKGYAFIVMLYPENLIPDIF